MGELPCHRAGVFRERAPDLILRQPYEGGHPAHDATAFAVQHAIHVKPLRAPMLIEFASYHRNPSSDSIEVGCFLPERDLAPLRIFLSRHEIEFKRRITSCFVSQTEVLSCFRLDVDGFCPAPAYDFSLP